ncbi:protein artichoke-like [Cylas formicarius]|uniref:protein artichoke-like n=1 Tax=Cylas formicarius TaxID=197179 RepID=UPI002958BCAB|nr:protein artichoke-like [Cylas formicarius]
MEITQLDPITRFKENTENRHISDVAQYAAHIILALVTPRIEHQLTSRRRGVETHGFLVASTVRARSYENVNVDIFREACNRKKMWQVFCLAIVLAVNLARTCPDMCGCRKLPCDNADQECYYTVVRCDGYTYNWTLSNTTTVLELINIDDEFCEFVQTLGELPRLETLSLLNSVPFNVSECFERLPPTVTQIKMLQSNLTQIPNLPANKSILSLDFSLNQISTVSQIKVARTLELLNLSANFICQIELNAFGELQNLKYLDLSRNKLTQLETGVLAPTRSLQFLNISHNSIEVLKEESFGTLALLEQLDVSWNKLAQVIPGSLQLPSLARLLLKGNPRLGKSHGVLVGTSRKLQTVDVSETGLRQVPSALTHSIKTLRIAGNSIEVISCGDMDPYPLLQLLDLSSNTLRSIEDDALGRLEFLSLLYISDNNIIEIPKSLPEGLVALYLDCNSVDKISSDDLEGLKQLEVLLLGDNNIRYIEAGAFKHLTSLVTLDLSRNPIRSLYPGSLSGPPALQVLKLSSIDIISSAKDVSFPLPSTEHLINLDLSKSPGLAKQLLADTAALAASRELQELDVSATNLANIRSDLLDFLPQLRLIHIKDNRLNCTDLRWLARWLRRHAYNEYRDVVCANPLHLRGVRLIDLQYVEVLVNHAKNEGKNTINPEKKTSVEKNASLLGQYSAEGTLDAIINDVIKNPVNGVGVPEYRRTLKTSKNKILSSTSIPYSISQTGKIAISESNNSTIYHGNLAPRNNNLSNGSGGDFNERVLNSSDSDDNKMQWNSSTYQISMYSITEQQTTVLHPGMIILAVGMLCGIATLAMLAARLKTKNKRARGNRDICREDIEVTSLPELW